jgi:putative transposase
LCAIVTAETSVISGLSVSPSRRRIGLYFQCHRKNIGHTEVCLFLRHLLRHLRGEVVVLRDRASIHRGAPIRELARRFSRLHLELFPAYAPQLNPDEEVWAQAKRALASRPEDLDDLTWRVRRTLERLRRSQVRLRGCIHHSELPPFLR